MIKIKLKLLYQKTAFLSTGIDLSVDSTKKAVTRYVNCPVDIAVIIER